MNDDINQSAKVSPAGLTRAVASHSSAGRGVRRLNNRPWLILFSLIGLVLAVILITLYEKAHPGNSNAAAAPANITAQGLPNEVSQYPNGEIPATEPPPPASASIPTPAGPPTDHSDSSTKNPADDAQQQAWQRYAQQQAQIDARKQQTALVALSAGTGISLGGPSGKLPQPTDSSATQRKVTVNDTAQGMQTALDAGQADPNQQERKRHFLSDGDVISDYLNHYREAAKSPFDIKAGTVIPAVMVSGLNSDLPGQLVARVRENVYDTATGKHLIIPQNATLIGTYDNSVTLGQERALTAWRRIIFPDASSIDLDLMPGADQSGYAGFTDRVNNHYWRIFGNAFMLSLFSAGIQLSQPQASNGSNISSQQTVAGALGQQMGELGEEVTRRNMQIQPTLEIRPGYAFNVMVTKDLVMPLWSGSH
jgi:type IV secretion system protein VirB10